MKSIKERIYERTVRDGDCMLWTGSHLHNGYGLFWDVGLQKSVLVHRKVWELEFGEIPSGLFVCHTCDIKDCINIDHLFLGTAADNWHDLLSKGYRTHTYRPRPSEDTLKSVYLDDRGYRLLASFFDLSHSVVYSIKKGRSYRAITQNLR